jgi:hypothetical protein
VVADATPAPILSTQRPKKVPVPLKEKMHRLLYPEYYEKKDTRNWTPTSAVIIPRPRRPEPKKMADKWGPVMREKGVQTSLSMYTLISSH